MCNSRKDSKSAPAPHRKIDYRGKAYKSKKKNKAFVTTGKKQTKNTGSEKHVMGFIHLGNMGPCESDGDVQISHFHFTILGKEDIYQDSKADNRLKAHDQAGLEYHKSKYNMF